MYSNIDFFFENSETQGLNPSLSKSSFLYNKILDRRIRSYIFKMEAPRTRKWYAGVLWRHAVWLASNKIGNNCCSLRRSSEKPMMFRCFKLAKKKCINTPGLNLNLASKVATYAEEMNNLVSASNPVPQHFNPLSANPTKWSNTLNALAVAWYILMRQTVLEIVWPVSVILQNDNIAFNFRHDPSWFLYSHSRAFFAPK